MSQIYSTEPQTAGRVILETTHGPLEINLWSRECPSTTKYFLQLCLDGFYEEAIFHRIVPNFLVQTGALRHDVKRNRQTSMLGDTKSKELQAYRHRVEADAALERRTYELNSRIRYNHRGQVAMALGVSDEGSGEELTVMQPQFFITLDEASELDGKHVCFGTVTGPTVFNALRIGQTDIDEVTSQPNILEEAPRIQRVKILENPIHTDIIPSPVIPWKLSSDGDGDGELSKKKKKKRKGVKNMNVLSFGDEMIEDENDTGKASGIKSSHDVITSKKLSNTVDKSLEKVATGSMEHQSVESKEPEKKNVSRSINEQAEEKPPVEDLMSTASAEPKGTQQELTGSSVTYQSTSERRKGSESESLPENGSVNRERANTPRPKKEKAPKVSLVEARRAKYAKRGTSDKRKRQADTMAKFMAFQTKVSRNVERKDSLSDRDDAIAARMSRRVERDESRPIGEESSEQAVSYYGQVLENNDDVEGEWMKTKFKCRKHQDHDAKLGGDGRSAMDDYEVVDSKERGTKSHKRPHHKNR